MIKIAIVEIIRFHIASDQFDIPIVGAAQANVADQAQLIGIVGGGKVAANRESPVIRLKKLEV